MTVEKKFSENEELMGKVAGINSPPVGVSASVIAEMVLDFIEDTIANDIIVSYIGDYNDKKSRDSLMMDVRGWSI